MDVWASLNETRAGWRCICRFISVSRIYPSENSPPAGFLISLAKVLNGLRRDAVIVISKAEFHISLRLFIRPR